MKKLWIVLTAVAGLVALIALGTDRLSSRNSYDYDAAAASAADFQLVGAKKCKTCHMSEKSGAQHTKWLAGPHAKAFLTLASPVSVAKAKELGIADPQKSPQCLKCHATAAPVMADMTKQTITMEEGVSCESCHGPGSVYWKKQVMEDVFAGTLSPESVGLILPVKEATCVSCHNNTHPFHVEFDYAQYSADVAHPYPAGFREAAAKKVGAK